MEGCAPFVPQSPEGKQGQDSAQWAGWKWSLETGDRADVGGGAPSGPCKKKDCRSPAQKLGFLTVSMETEASRCLLGCPPSLGVPTLREQEPPSQLGRQGLGRLPFHSPLRGIQSCPLTYTLSSAKTRAGTLPGPESAMNAGQALTQASFSRASSPGVFPSGVGRVRTSAGTLAL